MPLRPSVQAFLRARAEARMAHADADHQAGVEAAIAHVRLLRQEREAARLLYPHSTFAQNKNGAAPPRTAGPTTNGRNPR